MGWTRRAILAGGTWGAAAIAGGAWSMSRSVPAAKEQPDEPSPGPIQHPILGDDMAPKRLVVWGSYTCPFTAQLYGILYDIVKDMPKVASVEWRHFPVHPPDPALHVAGLGFEGVHFWGFTFKVLAEVLSKGGFYQGLTPEMLSDFAKAEGGSEETLQAAYADPAKWAAVKQDLLAGHLLGVTATPGLFYNGYFLTPQGLPFDKKAFDASLRAMLQHG
jgi:protein-disulfide isomerase